jgi:Flp pilus assembly protein TadG
MTGEMNRILARIGAELRGFRRNSSANVAMMFGLAMVPIIIAAGVGVDYARAALTRSQMSDALDAAALAVGSTQGLDEAGAKKLAQKYFEANYKGDTSHKMPTVTVDNFDSVKGSVSLKIDYTMDTAVLKAVGLKTMPVDTSSTVVWGQTKLWVALVLDNSLSMNQSSKMTSLRSAAKDLLTTLKKAASQDGDVLVGIVPFANDVYAGTGISSGYIDWTNWGAQLDADVPDSTYGPGDDCPYSYGCRTPGTTSKMSNNSSISNSGKTKGYICPWVTSSSNNTAGTNSHYYMGCFTSTATGSTKQVDSGSNASCGGHSTSSPKNCTCSGSGWSKTCSAKTWTHTWVAETDHTLWQGCFTDRTQDNDVSNTQPSGTTGFAADNNDLCPTSPVRPLGYDWDAMSDQITNMDPTGSTNQAIGLAHGWQMLTPGAPYGTPSVPANTTRYIILLSDGLNTQDRWYGNGMTESTSIDDKIDARMGTTCTNAKKDGIVIYTLYVNTGGSGDSDVLRDCASDTSKYFKLTSATQISTAFATIAAQITNVRVSK